MTRKSAWLMPALTLAAISTSPAALSRAEAQSARPQFDFNESAERARTLLADGRSQFEWELRITTKGFELFNDCEPVTVEWPKLALFSNSGIEADIAAMQSTARRIQRTAETRFRNTGVLDEEARKRGRFQIRITGSPDDFYARASFQKVVIDLATGEVAFADTWGIAGFGGRGRMDRTPEAKASSSIDQFLADYLAANAGACAERGIP